MHYVNLDLRISSDGGTYRIRIVRQMGGEATARALLPFTETDAAQLLHHIHTATAENIQDDGRQLSLSRLNRRLPRGQAQPKVVQGIVEFHHEIADTRLPQAKPVFDDATALHTAVDMLDP